MDFYKNILKQKVKRGSLAIFWIGQAGFVFKTDKQKIIYVDPYLTDCVEHLYGFKRLTPSLVNPEEVHTDYYISTHHHEDHLDTYAIPVVAKVCDTKFIAPPNCIEKCIKLGVDKSRCLKIEAGDVLNLNGVKVHGVPADHGELAPEAIGLILDFGFVKVYFTGDTGFNMSVLQKNVKLKPEIIIPIINGAYGNLNHEEAAKLVKITGSKIAIPCHFWMFAEHNGDPQKFIEACKRIAPKVKVELLQQLQPYIYTK